MNFSSSSTRSFPVEDEKLTKQHQDDALSEFDPVKYKSLGNPSQHFESDPFRSSEEYSPYRALHTVQQQPIAQGPLHAPKTQDFSSGSLQFGKAHGFELAESVVAHEAVAHFSKHLQIADNPPPRPIGNYLEPHHHVFSSKAPQELFLLLQHALFQLDIDFSVADRQEYQLKCAAYDVATELPFICSIFTAPSGDIPYIVEIQRRHGDVFKFSKIYRSILEQLVAAQAIGSSALPPARRLLVPPPLPSLDPVDLEAAKEAIQILVNMANADFIDVKLEGLYALAQLTLEQDKRQILIELALPLFTTCLSHAYESVHRAALTSLANLAEADVACCQALRDNGAVALMLPLTSSATPQVVREAFRLLSNMATSLGKLLNDTDMMSTATSFVRHRDARTRLAADKIIRSLKV